MIKNFDFIIVGQGLAGTTLAHTFLGQGKTVLVVDDGAEITSSKVAAGIWNPIVFKRYTASFLAQQLIQFNTTFYPQVELQTGKNFYHPLLYYKIFASADDVQHWQGKLADEEVEGFLGKEIYHNLSAQSYNAPEGAAPVLHCGYLDTKKYIASTASFLSAKGMFLQEVFEHDKLNITDSGVEYKGNQAQKIIFCEGLKTLANPFWAQIPFSPVKGEVLTIKAQLPNAEKAIVSKGIFIVPLGGDVYRVGSTYRWQDMENTPTEDAKRELTEKLNNLLNAPYEIIEHVAAVRPAAIGRRPFVGLHPQNNKVGILNGLGSRGVMLAPYFAHQLVQHILNNGPLHPEVDVKRIF